MRTLENIKAGLFNRAISKFQVQAVELERDKKLFLDWMAYELYLLYKEMDKSRAHIVSNHAQRLQTNRTNRPAPIHVIAQASPKKNNLE